MRRPKLSSVGVVDIMLKTCRNEDKVKAAKLKRLGVAEKKLVKDLDVSTYVRTVNKVKGIVQCLLDDKQRVMLKYNKNQMIDILKTKTDTIQPTDISKVVI